ncbi:hypothetical protein Vretifemale_5788 [Volvox reticuliferus]|nr:hypothetical protein Vretifemale_5788 [Volvox reticuliferus]
MDSVLTNIRAWKQKHEREMLELRQRNEHALSQVAEAVMQLEQDSPLKPISIREDGQAVGAITNAVATPDSWTSRLSPSCQQDFGHAKVSHEQQQCQQSRKEQASGGLPPMLQLGEEDDEDLVTLLRERHERHDRILSGSAAVKLGLASETAQAHAPVLDQALIGSYITDADAQGQPQQTRVTREGSGGGSSQPMSTPGQPSLESVLRASIPRPARPQHLLGSAPSERPTTAARRRAEEAANAAVLRGQQLLSELEAELRELDGGERGPRRTDLRASSSDRGSDVMGTETGTATPLGFWEAGRPRSGQSGAPTGSGMLGGDGGDEDADHSAPSTTATAPVAGYPHVESLMNWSAQLQGVLAKMDALQTGYQVVAAAAATAARGSGTGDAASAGFGAGGSRPGSGGTCASTAAGAGWGTASPSGASLTSRPGSARVRLEPLPRGPCLSSGVLTGQELASGMTRIPSQSSPSSSVSPVAGSALAAVTGLEGNGQSHKSRSRVTGLRGVAGSGEACVAAERQGSGADNRDDDSRSSSCEREPAENGAGPVACAGHRIRQLRELQRQGAGGTSTGNATCGAVLTMGEQGAGRGVQSG